MYRLSSFHSYYQELNPGENIVSLQYDILCDLVAEEDDQLYLGNLRRPTDVNELYFDTAINGKRCVVILTPDSNGCMNLISANDILHYSIEPLKFLQIALDITTIYLGSNIIEIEIKDTQGLYKITKFSIGVRARSFYEISHEKNNHCQSILIPYDKQELARMFATDVRRLAEH